MNLTELLAKADAPDDLEFTAADGTKFKLADIRGFRSSIDGEKTALQNKQREAERIAKEAQDLLTNLDAAMKEMQKNQNKNVEPQNKVADWKKNPLYEDLVPVLDALEGRASAFEKIANDTKAALDKAQATYAFERLRRQWAEAKTKPKDKKFEDVVQEVLTRKELDELGLPTLEPYLNRAAEPDRIKEAVDAALAKQKQEFDQQMRMAGTTKPGNTRFSTKKAGEPPIKNLSELTSDVIANDPDVAAAMNGAEN